LEAALQGPIVRINTCEHPLLRSEALWDNRAESAVVADVGRGGLNGNLQS
jgi:hypothetical protein